MHCRFVGGFCCVFLSHTVQCFCTSMSKTLKNIVPCLMSLFISRFLFLNTPSPMFLRCYVQGTCSYYSIVNETILHYFFITHDPWLHPVQYFFDYMSKNTCNYYAMVNESLSILDSFSWLHPSKASRALHPKHLEFKYPMVNQTVSTLILFLITTYPMFLWLFGQGAWHYFSMFKALFQI